MRLLQFLGANFRRLNGIFACALILLALPSQASDREISHHLQGSRSLVVEATVVTLPAAYYTPVHLKEDELSKFGCTFKVSGQRDLKALLDVLVAGQIVETDWPDSAGPDPRLGVYLKYADGSTEKLLFEGLSQGPVQVFGVYKDAVQVRAMNPQFANELRAWGAARRPEPGLKCKEYVNSPVPVHSK